VAELQHIETSSSILLPLHRAPPKNVHITFGTASLSVVVPKLLLSLHVPIYKAVVVLFRIRSYLAPGNRSQ
jgi:hypothetical protein